MNNKQIMLSQASGKIINSRESMKKIFCIAVLMTLSAWCFAAPNYTSPKEIRNLVGAKRLPHKKLTPPLTKRCKMTLEKTRASWIVVSKEEE